MILHKISLFFPPSAETAVCNRDRTGFPAAAVAAAGRVIAMSWKGWKMQEEIFHSLSDINCNVNSFI